MGCCCTNPKPEDTSFLEQVPQKRDNCSWWLSLTLCFLTASGIFAYGFIFNTIVEYKVDNVNDIKNEIKNITASCYRRNEKKTYYVLLNLGLGLVGMIFGNFVGRLCLVAGECRNWSRRYVNTDEMFKACFSGTSWYAVLACLILIVPSICVPLVNDSAFELEYMLYIVSGIGVGPLIIHLLNLNTKSNVDISTIIEEKETSVGTTLAWSYYVNYLEKVLPKFTETSPMNSSRQTQDQSSGSTHADSRLNKLILIISLDCSIKDDLAKLDNRIKKDDEITMDKFELTVYFLNDETKKFYFIAHYAKEPLETIATMTIKSKAIKDSDEREYQVKMFYKTLHEILDDPRKTEFKEKLILLPIKDSLKNEEVVKSIKKNFKLTDSNQSINIEGVNKALNVDGGDKSTTS